MPFLKILKWLLNNWTRFAEIGTLIWAITGIMSEYRSSPSFSLCIGDCYDYHFSPVLAYFLSAVLILYLLRKYEKQN